jgi:hypothetical protein
LVSILAISSPCTRRTNTLILIRPLPTLEGEEMAKIGTNIRHLTPDHLLLSSSRAFLFLSLFPVLSFLSVRFFNACPSHLLSDQSNYDQSTNANYPTALQTSLPSLSLSLSHPPFHSITYSYYKSFSPPLLSPPPVWSTLSRVSDN